MIGGEWKKLTVDAEITQLKRRSSYELKWWCILENIPLCVLRAWIVRAYREDNEL